MLYILLQPGTSDGLMGSNENFNDFLPSYRLTFSPVPPDLRNYTSFPHNCKILLMQSLIAGMHLYSLIVSSIFNRSFKSPSWLLICPFDEGQKRL